MSAARNFEQIISPRILPRFYAELWCYISMFMLWRVHCITVVQGKSLSFFFSNSRHTTIYFLNFTKYAFIQTAAHANSRNVCIRKKKKKFMRVYQYTYRYRLWYTFSGCRISVLPTVNCDEEQSHSFRPLAEFVLAMCSPEFMCAGIILTDVLMEKIR